LLEGYPGASKDSLVEALAAAGSPMFLRVNLPDHSELADLGGGFLLSSDAGDFLLWKRSFADGHA
jgi:midasin (ATPase involved in ribosome maturation)